MLVPYYIIKNGEVTFNRMQICLYCDNEGNVHPALNTTNKDYNSNHIMMWGDKFVPKNPVIAI